jgi:stage II sporulation protein D
VAATRGDVVTYHGTPVATYFFASSGGYTEDNEDVWPGGTPDPWLRAVRDPYDASGGDPYHRWAINLSVPAAAAKLARLVKGKLVGIRILRHGVSPRIVTGQVVGSRGTTTVDGAQLQSAFGLRSTYAAFTTITTVPTGPVARSHTTTAATAWLPARAAEAVLSVGPAVHSLVNASRRGLHGVVFPGAVHSVVVVQELGPHGWRKVTHTRLRRAGAYQVTVAGPGRYRVVYRGLDGPTVRVG